MKALRCTCSYRFVFYAPAASKVSRPRGHIRTRAKCRVSRGNVRNASTTRSIVSDRRICSRQFDLEPSRVSDRNVSFYNLSNDGSALSSEEAGTGKKIRHVGYHRVVFGPHKLRCAL